MTRSAPTAGSSDTPTVLGLLFLGFTAILFNLHSLDLFHLHDVVLAAGIFYGSLGQIGAGLAEWRLGRAFGAVTFTALGLFWLSLIAMFILPGAGLGEAPPAAAISAYLLMWSAFLVLLFLGTFGAARDLPLPLGLLLLSLLLLVAGTAASHPLLPQLARWTGVLGGLVASGTALTRLFSAVFRRSAVPFGMEVQKRA